ncbi:MAG: hypothetical protein CL878_13460 [Dehalococcoidia bacterium]|nr:hypothetical protein [Dehalococcoidia bacterium]
MVVRYAPGWLNLDVSMPGSDECKRMVEEPVSVENSIPAAPREVYENPPENVQPLYRHGVRWPA